jgi:hypothetical protein
MSEASNGRTTVAARQLVARLVELVVGVGFLSGSALFVATGHFFGPLPLLSAGSAVAADSASACEVAPSPLSLGAPLDRDDIELSGLAWHGDTLVVLPQYPSRAAPEGTQRLYGLPRTALVRAVADSTAPPIDPIPIALIAGNMTTATEAYQGFEAIAFVGHHTYLLMERARDSAGMDGLLFQGHATPGLQRIELQTAEAWQLPMQAALRNMSYEALTTRADTVLALFEANGAHVNPQPRVYRYGATQPAGSVPFPTLEYRLTDATSMDTASRFWITNYFFPGEQSVLQPAADSLTRRFGEGQTHRTSEVVERLVEYQYTPSGIVRTGTPPIQLKLDGGTGRNWEGLARLDDGFLLATDRYPSTLLAYVPGPRADSACGAHAP